MTSVSYSWLLNNTLKVSKYGVFSGPNTGKYGPEKTPYLDTFHAAKASDTARKVNQSIV